jgi:hypothetical protein
MNYRTLVTFTVETSNTKRRFQKSFTHKKEIPTIYEWNAFVAVIFTPDEKHWIVDNQFTMINK